MSTCRADNPESVLTKCYSTQTSLYARALTLTDELSQVLSCEGDSTHLFQSLNDIVTEVAMLDSEMSAIRAEIESRGRKPGLSLRKAVTDVRGILGRLIEKISVAEALAAQARDRLLPGINAETQRQRMLRAYGNQHGRPTNS